jgi:hypothetical protein
MELSYAPEMKNDNIPFIVSADRLLRCHAVRGDKVDSRSWADDKRAGNVRRV